MSPADINAVQLAELVRRGLQLADRAVVTDIEMFATPSQGAFNRWYDVRPMLDAREHSDPVVDMNTEALDYARMRGLIERNTDYPHLVRITRQP